MRWAWRPTETWHLVSTHHQGDVRALCGVERRHVHPREVVLADRAVTSARCPRCAAAARRAGEPWPAELAR